MASSAPFTEDALNRFRITHSDRDLRPLLRRIHRYPHLSQQNNGLGQGQKGEEEVKQGNGGEEIDAELEREMIELEMIKWKMGVERVMASVENLKRQRETYLQRAEETVQRTEQLRSTLAAEKVELEGKRRLRDHQIQCDEVAKRIRARGKGRAELDEQITTLSTSLEEQRASHAVYLQTVQSRLETFSQITKLIDECRNTKLPVELHAVIEEEEKMEVDTSVPTSSSVKLSATAMPFQPSITITPTAAASTSSTSSFNANATASNTGASTTAARPSAAPQQGSSSSLKPPSGPHGLPSRPSTSQLAGARPTTSRNPPSGVISTSLPARPSALRSSTTPAAPQSAGISSLEDGEVGEEGEVGGGGGDGRGKRGREEGPAGRSTRSRK